MLQHNSKTLKNEPDWRDDGKLPREAYSNFGHPDRPEEWRYAHHFIQNGRVGGKHNRYVSGEMYLHVGRLEQLLENTSEMSVVERTHLRRHAIASKLIDPDTQMNHEELEDYSLGQLVGSGINL